MLQQGRPTRGVAAPVRLLFVALVAAVGLAACQSDQARLEGEREKVLAQRDTITVDPDAAEVPLELGDAATNADWPQPGFNSRNRPGNLALTTPLEKIWRDRVGRGGGGTRGWAIAPIVAEGRVYAMDTKARLAAFDLDTGERLWRRPLAADAERGLLGPATPYQAGGLAYRDGQVYAAGAHSELVAIKARSGKVAWREELPTMAHAGPKIAGDRLFVRTTDNRLIAYRLNDAGELAERLWRFEDIPEPAQLLGGGEPAIAGSRIVAGFSSGTLAGLRTENGRQVWEARLAPGSTRRGSQRITDIAAPPVMADGGVFAVGHAEVTTHVAGDTGREIWRLPAGGRNRPQLAGGHLFMVTEDAVVLAIRQDDGRVRWRQELPRFGDQEAGEDPIAWYGPVLGGSELWFTGSQGRLFALDPDSGEIVRRRDVGGEPVTAPIVADKRLMYLTDSGYLHVFR